MDERIRSPICTVVGHVDHGKSSILDYIRGSTIVKREAGGITQAIGASIVPKNSIEKISGDFLKVMKFDLVIPSLLFIDTPGHEAFTNMRKRGGNLADIAIVVVDITEGFKPQTIEAIEILKQYKTPFVIAANKVDKIPFWTSSKKSLIESLNSQPSKVKEVFETQLYTLVGSLFELGFESERFDRVTDFKKQVAIIPTSAITGEGISELLAFIAGLSQKFLGDKLNIQPNSCAKGTILEVKQLKGLGTVMDTIIYDGTIKRDDCIVVGDVNEPIVTKVKAIYTPQVMQELRDSKAKTSVIKEVTAATGVRISAPNTEHVVSGMPIRVATNENINEVIDDIKKETQEVLFETDDMGIIVKADSLGSLEALIKILKDNNIPIKTTGIGDISKKDISMAESLKDKNELCAVILGFNVKTDSTVDSIKDHVPTLISPIIYQLIDDYKIWYEEKRNAIEKRKMEKLSPISKYTILPGYVFRQCNPAVVGVEILEGTIKTGAKVMNKDGKVVGLIKSIKNDKQENVNIAKKGLKVPISITEVIIGRGLQEREFIYCDINEREFRLYKEFRKFLTTEEIDILKEIAQIKRKNNPTWGI